MDVRISNLARGGGHRTNRRGLGLRRHAARPAADRAYPSSIAADLDGAPVFLATSAFNLRYDQERWPKIVFADVKDYQKWV